MNIFPDNSRLFHRGLGFATPPPPSVTHLPVLFLRVFTGLWVCMAVGLFKFCLGVGQMRQLHLWLANTDGKVVYAQWVQCYPILFHWNARVSLLRCFYVCLLWQRSHNLSFFRSFNEDLYSFIDQVFHSRFAIELWLLLVDWLVVKLI